MVPLSRKVQSTLAESRCSRLLFVMIAVYAGVWCLFEGKFREPWLNLGAADCCLFVAMHILTSSAAYNLSFIHVSICVLLYERKTFQKTTLQQSHMNVITVSIHPKESLFQHLQNFPRLMKLSLEFCSI